MTQGEKDLKTFEMFATVSLLILIPTGLIYLVIVVRLMFSELVG